MWPRTVGGPSLGAVPNLPETAPEPYSISVGSSEPQYSLYFLPPPMHSVSRGVGVAAHLGAPGSHNGSRGLRTDPRNRPTAYEHDSNAATPVRLGPGVGSVGAQWVRRCLGREGGRLCEVMAAGVAGSHTHPYGRFRRRERPRSVAVSSRVWAIRPDRSGSSPAGRKCRKRERRGRQGATAQQWCSSPRRRAAHFFLRFGAGGSGISTCARCASG